VLVKLLVLESVIRSHSSWPFLYLQSLALLLSALDQLWRTRIASVAIRVSDPLLESSFPAVNFNFPFDFDVGLKGFDLGLGECWARSSDEEVTPVDDRFSKADGYHAFPPPITRNFLTPRANISFAGKTNEVNVEKPKSVYESVVSTPNINKEKVIIEDWNSDDENDMSDVVTTSPVRTNETQTVRTKVDKINQVNPVRPNANTVRPQVNPVRPNISTARVKNMSTAGTKAVVNTGKGKMDNALKKSRWVWRPKGNYMDHESKEKGSFILKKFKYGNPEICLQDHTVVDSGCSSHMTGKKAYLSDYEDYNGVVAFGSDPKGGKITGKGKIRTANLDFDDVFFIDELKFNLFSVSKMCDKKNSVLFTNIECLILSPSFKLLDENQAVLRAPRQNGVYSLDLKNIVPSGGITCLYANETTDESKLWHRRLGHVNFKNINKLVKGHLVRGLPSKVFVNDHTCVACKKGKQHKASCKAKLERTIRKPLELLHMDLFGPVSVESINKKKYCLVMIDDFSRFSWVFFLAIKDETNEILYKFIIGLENQLNHKVKIIRCDHGTEFKNHAMNEFCAKKGIKREFSTQEHYVTGSSEKDKEPTQEYILLPLHPHRPRILVEDVVQAAQEKPSKNSPKDNDVQDSENVAEKEEQHTLTEAEQVLKDDLERMIAQEITAKTMDDAIRQAFEEEKKRAAQATSINKLNTGRPSVSTSNSPLVSTANTPYASVVSTPTGANTGGSLFVYLEGRIPIDASTLPNADLPIDPNMSNLGDDSDVFPNDGIFSGAFDDEDVGAEANFNNMDNTIDVSPIPTLRVHKDHPKGQILGDPKSAVQTKGNI
ncbi:putative ribonuclease H-like domain-containing protein, partial [Tanacetum coccineum]